ncbi:MAG TPA: PorV/PorQ family protein [Gemmatimonadaceae bacterium]|jgi:outer membrane protein OmpA-like peptidoglycan-associated protein
MLRARYLAFLLALPAPAALAQTATTGNKPVSIAGGAHDNGVFASTLLEMGISPRAVALGEAMGAVEGDPSSMWYNAAGLARIKTNSLMAVAAQRFGDTQLGGATVTFPTDIGTFAIAGRALNEGTIEQTTNYTISSRCRAYQYELEGGGALQLATHLMIGGSLFYAQQSLCNQSAASIGVNAGVMLPEFYWSRLTLGGGLRNWGTQATFDSLSERPPLTFYLAGAVDLLRHSNLMQTPVLFSGQPILLDAKLVGQVSFPYQQEVYPAAGIEATVNGVVIGRIGYQFGPDNRAGLSLGAGINVGQFRLEYGFRNRQNVGASFFSYDPIGDEHHVSATLFFGGPQTNQPVVPVIINQPIDTAAINAAVREAVSRELASLRPLLDSLRNARVEVQRIDSSAMVSRYIVPIHFDFDSSVVREGDMATLGQVAEVIRRAYPTALVTIEGFADPAGSRDYNMRLSRRRAEAVKAVMISRFNLPSAQFRTIGYGEQFERQVAPGARRNDAGAEENRRVTFTIDATRHF